MTPANVLIVDDNIDLAENLGEVLTDEGYLCEIEATGAGAIRRIEQSEYGLVITDLRMHGADGIQVAAAAQRRSPPTPVVIITAFAGDPQLDAARKVGVTEVVTKPVDPSALVALVKRRMSNGDV